MISITKNTGGLSALAASIENPTSAVMKEVASEPKNDGLEIPEFLRRKAGEKPAPVPAAKKAAEATAAKKALPPIVPAKLPKLTWSGGIAKTAHALYRAIVIEKLFTVTAETAAGTTKVCESQEPGMAKQMAAEFEAKLIAAKAPKFTPPKVPAMPKTKAKKESAVRTNTKTKAKAPAKKAAKAAPKADKGKKAAKANARTPVKSARPDGLREGSKQAVMLDLAARTEGATEAEICKKLGWKKCRVTLKRVCEKVGAKLDRKVGPDKVGRFFAILPKAKAAK